jgi:hypothetical protein
MWRGEIDRCHALHTTLNFRKITMNTTLRTAVAALAFAVVGAAYASDATNFAVPATSETTRASVQVEARRALAAGELNYNDASGRIEAPMATAHIARDSVRKEAVAAMQTRRFGDRSLSSLYYVGGM